MAQMNKGKVFAVVLGSVHFLFVVINVNAHIGERWNHKGDAAEEVPDKAKLREGVFLQMGQFMDENNRPIEAENRNDGQNDLVEGEVGEIQGARKATPAQQSIEEKVGPIDHGAGLEKVFHYFFGFRHRKGDAGFGHSYSLNIIFKAAKV
jgi:hypothetical protein